jgi:hypothetical protein
MYLRRKLIFSSWIYYANIFDSDNLTAVQLWVLRNLFEHMSVLINHCDKHNTLIIAVDQKCWNISPKCTVIKFTFESYHSTFFRNFKLCNRLMSSQVVAQYFFKLFFSSHWLITYIQKAHFYYHSFFLLLT